MDIPGQKCISGEDLKKYMLEVQLAYYGIHLFQSSFLQGQILWITLHITIIVYLTSKMLRFI